MSRARWPSAMQTGGSEYDTRKPARRPQHRIFGVNQCPGRGAGKEVGDHHRAVLGDEHIMQQQGFAAGPGKPQGLPVVDDLDLGERRQRVGDCPRVAGLAEERAQDRPLRIVATAGKWIPA